jgi:AbrB family looped-hinge helix DNA binding protein
MTTNMTSKGQVTVPKPVRDYLGLHAGAAVRFDRLPSGEVVLRPAKSGGPRHNRFGGIRGRAMVRLSTAAIMKLTRRS